MAGSSSRVGSLREQRARTTLRKVRSEGHSYVELREDNKKPMFFCVLCLVRCYSPTVLHDHLHGRSHKKMYEDTKSTLLKLKENPWPFNDGMFFFHPRCDENDGLQNESTDKSGLDIGTPEGNQSSSNFTSETSLRSIGGDESVDSDGNGYDLIIPDVLHKDKVSDLAVRSIGVGKIAVRAYETDGVTKGISRIWCEWLGDRHANQEDIVPQHEFAIVLFTFNYDMGRKALLDDTLLSNTRPAPEENKERKGKKRKSPSDPEDVSDSLSNQLESSGEGFQASGGSGSKNLLKGRGDKSLQSRVMRSRSLRKELRLQQRLATIRVCDICKHKILPGKDVATFVNIKTGRLVCSSRNLIGAFHVYHISCLIYWVLFCEYEVYTKQLIAPKEVKTRYRRKKGARASEAEKEVQKQIDSAFCPECQGTGIDIDGDELEELTVSLDEMYKYKMKICDGRRGYTKSPEMLENCSIGFYFPPQPEGTMQEYVSPLKMLRFYRAVE